MSSSRDATTDRAGQRWHLLCQVIDNFGDAGVMWRLARQLHEEHGCHVHLFIDQPEVLERLAPEAERPPVVVSRLDDDATVGRDADVIVCGFQVRLPRKARAALKSRQPCPPQLIQLEYLSAEDWVADGHGLPSLQPDGLTEHFFNPGFSADTGGLLRERDLLQRRDAFLADPAHKFQWLTAHGIPPDFPDRATADTLPPAGRPLLASVLCYPSAPLLTWLTAWLNQPTLPPLHLLLPGADTQPWLQSLVPLAQAHPHRLRLSPLPFLPQTEFDPLLWCCDLNLVRGEDSWLRALWAGIPWLWQAYPQDDAAHLQKLDAFLTRITPWLADEPAFPAWQRALRVWNQAPGHDVNDLVAWLQHPSGAALSRRLASATAAHVPDLAGSLMAFAQAKRTA